MTGGFPPYWFNNDLTDFSCSLFSFSESVGVPRTPSGCTSYALPALLASMARVVRVHLGLVMVAGVGQAARSDVGFSVWSRCGGGAPTAR